MRRLLPLVLMTLGLFLAADARGADWPQYRYDAGRSAASLEQLPATLDLQWVRHLPAPRPAFPDEVRLRFDASYEPVVMGKLMFLASPNDGSVTAYHTETGEEKWNAVVEEIVDLSRRGRPVLVGTISIEKSEHLSALLRQRIRLTTLLH